MPFRHIHEMRGSAGLARDIGTEECHAEEKAVTPRFTYADSFAFLTGCSWRTLFS